MKTFIYFFLIGFSFLTLSIIKEGKFFKLGSKWDITVIKGDSIYSGYEVDFVSDYSILLSKNKEIHEGSYYLVPPNKIVWTIFFEKKDETIEYQEGFFMSVKSEDTLMFSSSTTNLFLVKKIQN